MRRKRSNPVLPMLALACCALAFPGTAAALPLCDLTGNASFTPVHPQATDVIGFDVTLSAVYSGPPQLILSKATSGPGLQATLDIVVTTDAMPFIDHEVARGAIQGPISRGRGTVGRAAVGEYAVTVIVRRYNSMSGMLDEPCSRKLSRFFVYPDDGLAPVVEYFYPLLNHYFMTQNAAEIAALDAGARPGWERTGQTLLAYRPGQTNFQLPAVQRFYGLPSAELDTHFFTIDFADQFALTYGPLSSAWVLETDNAFEIGRPDQDGNCPAGQIPVYRLWNQRVDSNHRYTADRAIKAQMIANGYVAEGYGPDIVDMCALVQIIKGP
ncbi:MAG: hypothetical protein M3R31_00490 [Pseudomonadota bacterium]|nr:hypothetical protein [Pseudomonadota bacterium]